MFSRFLESYSGIRALVVERVALETDSTSLLNSTQFAIAGSSSYHNRGSISYVEFIHGSPDAEKTGTLLP
jgi:hypothetical protein